MMAFLLMEEMEGGSRDSFYSTMLGTGGDLKEREREKRAGSRVRAHFIVYISNCPSQSHRYYD